MTKSLIILGAGYGGAFLASNLASDDVDVILVDRRAYHELNQELHLVVAGFRKPEEIRIPIASLLSGTRTKFVQDTVKGVDLQKRKILLESGNMSYDMLVIALGAITEYFDVLDAEKHTQPLRSAYDAEKIYEQLHSLTKSGDGAEIVVVGGGATGVTIAGALADFAEQQAEGRLSVRVLEATGSLLPQWDPRVAEKAAEVLQKKGVEVMLNAKVSECLPGIIRLQDGRNIKTPMAIWTAGVKAYELETVPDIPRTDNGRILVDSSCQLEGRSDVYAIGDIAAARDKGGRFYPATAQIAVRQAKYLADRFSGRTDRTFDYDVKAQVLSLGVDDHVLLLGDWLVTGNLASLVEEFSRRAYRSIIESGASDLYTRVYEEDLFSRALAGVTFAGFAFRKVLDRF